ncbi:hypothetical protein GLAREA_00092 [Glarea lozoyensis ATCC 20868]|uniref:Uncharacterized protein n=1 Tax=Glarea lozoyensis (strain ATCC 20868 / MF5171) TaxID=1116229 RepID=S3CVF3_GLAL2|nr:uncharacterized protein GLAREA_00092 [Glarea lozoyensis ATCC 20868]EPE28934.1 hypothetical protein GLAREA_00092 [Glarea lozoyensis ATCC 20868]
MYFTIQALLTLALLIFSLFNPVFSSPTHQIGSQASISSKDVISYEAPSMRDSAQQLTDYMKKMSIENDPNFSKNFAAVGLTMARGLQSDSSQVFARLKPPSHVAADANGNAQKLTLVTDALGAVVANPTDVALARKNAKLVLCLLNKTIYPALKVLIIEAQKAAGLGLDAGTFPEGNSLQIGLCAFGGLGAIV